MNNSSNQNINALPIGTVLHNGEREYKIKSVLGQGGFGITYLTTAEVKAGNVIIDAKFAIKEFFDKDRCLRQGKSIVVANFENEQLNKEDIQSFLSEANKLRNLSHPNIVRVNESFKENGTAYYVMQYVEGGNLYELVKRNKRLTEDQALRIITKVAHAVKYIHSKKIVHFDIKPENILIKNEGSPILIDFGLAKRYDWKGRPTMTNKAAGQSIGYAPIEQASGGITEFSPEADIYALAATLLFMLTGKIPEAASRMSADKIRLWLKGLTNENVCNAIVHGMALLKENRTHSVEQFLKELNIESYSPKVTKKINTIGKNLHFGIFRKIAKDANAIINSSFILLAKNKKKIGIVVLSLISLFGIYIYYPYLRKLFVKGSDDTEVGTLLVDSLQQQIIEEKTERQTDSANVVQSISRSDSIDDAFKVAMRSSDWKAIEKLAKQGYAKAFCPLAEHYYSIKDFKSAKLWAEKAIKAKVDGTKAKNILEKVDRVIKAEEANAAYIKAEQYMKEKKYDKALPYAQKALMLGSEHKDRINEIIKICEEWNLPVTE